MVDYKIDRNMLESKSTEEILHILRKERDDYTPEAIEFFEKILAERGVRDREVVSHKSGTSSFKHEPNMILSGDLLIRNPSDAVMVLNNLLNGVLNGRLDPKVAEVSTNLVMDILRAMEQEYMTESEEGE